MTRPVPGARSRTPLLSIVIPTLDEERTVAALLGDLAMVTVPHEVIVVDGGSADETVAVATSAGARVVRTGAARGTQLAAGARAAAAPTLCFLHADVRLPNDARMELARIAEGPTSGAFAFRFRIDARGWRYRLVEIAVRLRVQLFRLPYGDQGLIVSRAHYEAAGGYPDIPLMEDVALVDALRRVTTLRALRPALHISARRWEREGLLVRIVRNWRIMIAYRLGASPAKLAAQYRPLGDMPTARRTIRQTAADRS
jgi:rSAM/selenodomain-associated transferase 2